MTCVQQPHFHLFIGQNIRGHFSAGLFPSGTSMKEMILDYPLPESLWDHRPSIIDTEFFPYKRAMCVCRCRRDPVDHAVRKRTILFQPVPKRRISKLGESQEHSFSDFSVALDVVTRHSGEQTRPSLAPPIHAFAQLA